MNYTEITLASDDSFSNVHFPGNTLNRFRNVFDHTLHFENGGEIAIKKVTFFSTMWNIHSGNSIVYYSNTSRNKSQAILKFSLPTTRVQSRQHFIELLDKTATDSVDELKQIRSETVYRIVDTAPSPHPRLKLRVADDVQIYLHKSILRLLGFDDLITDKFDDLRHPDVPTTHFLFPDSSRYSGVNVRMDNYFRNDPTLLFSCDMSKSTHLYGHRKISSMLEIVTANLDRGGELTEHVPQHLSWYPLCRKDFSSAEVSINTRDGVPAPLVYGPVVVQFVVRDTEDTHNQL
jgi:hypothetical protein